MARPPRRPDRPAGHPAWPARFGAAVLRRVARAVQRAADTLAPAASSAAAAPPPEPPPRLPGQPPEHWLAVVREHAPELLLGRDPAAFDRPSRPGYAQPLAVPPALAIAGIPADTPIAAAIATASDPGTPDAPHALRPHSTGDDRSVGRIRHNAGEMEVPAARDLARHDREMRRGASSVRRVWERLSGKARAETPPVDGSLHSRQTGPPVPAMRLNPAPAPDRFPAWSWVGPAGDADERTRPAYRTTAAEWPGLPAVSNQSAEHRARAAVSHPAAPLEMNDEASPWPDLPDDAPLWTVPVTGYSAERLARLAREQAGG